jgi:hypothetical protein
MVDLGGGCGDLIRRGGGGVTLNGSHLSTIREVYVRFYERFLIES